MNKRLFVYVGVSVAVAAAFNIASHGMFPYDADLSDAVNACKDGTFDGIASPLGPGQMRAEDCFMLGVLYMASISAWLVSIAAAVAAAAFGFMWIVRTLKAKRSGV